MIKPGVKVKTALFAAATAAALAGATGTGQALTYDIDPTHSAVIFGAQHFGAGYTYGRFNQLEGLFVLDEEQPENNRVKLQIGAGSIDTNSEERDKHLTGKDFFDAENQPLITFTSTKVAPIEGKPGMFLVSGEVKMLGQSKTLDVEVRFTGKETDPFRNIRAGGVAKFTIKRSEFGMSAMLDKIGDEIDLIVSIEGVEAKEG